MTDKDKKLAEEILSKKWIPQFNKAGVATGRHIVFDNDTIEALNTYHTAKMREQKIVESFDRENEYVTDEDIKEWAITKEPPLVSASTCAYILGSIDGAKAMRNGEIKHNK